MPEGDSLFRAARSLDLALAGAVVTRFESVFPRLTRVDAGSPLRGRTVDRVTARGKHLLIWFSGDLILHTHLRMHGSWHIYRPGERWFRPRHEMRIVIETADMHAIAFNVPVAEFTTAAGLSHLKPLQALGPDPLAPGFSRDEAVERIAARADAEIGDALLDQSAIAGIGNIFKAEVLFVGGINPFVPVAELGRDTIGRLVDVAVTLLRGNVADGSSAMATYPGARRTTGRMERGARFWVYQRAGKPCRRCGTPIAWRRQGPHARATYWCETCQRAGT